MNKVLVLLVAGGFAVSLSACKNEAALDETDPQASAAGSAATPAQAAVPATDEVMVGKAVGPDGAVTTAVAMYSPGDTVHASIPTSTYAAGSDVAVYWNFQDGSSVMEEHRPIQPGERYVTFNLSNPNGLRPGKYTVRMDVDKKPVEVVDFFVK